MTIPLFKVVHTPAIEQAALDVLRSGQIASGAHVENFRRRFGALVGTDQVVTVNDMTSAISIALRLAGAGSGADVITSPLSCLSTNSAIATCGATPVWADIDPRTGTLDVDDVAAQITARTKAVILYHLAGYPGPAAALARLCQERGIALIEDCDNALGATIDGQPAGSFGDFAIWSFYPNRQIAAIEGGAIACRRREDHERALRLRRFGIDAPYFRDALGEIDPASDVPEIGWSAAFNNLGSAIGLAQLDGLSDRLSRTRANVARLRAIVAPIAGVEAIAPLPGADPAYWVMMLRCDDRDRVMTSLKSQGIACSKLHHRNDDYSGFKATRRSLPGIDALSRHMLAVPCGWWLEQADLDRIGQALAVAVGGHEPALRAAG